VSKRGTEHLETEINILIDRFRKEYEMTYAEVVGTLLIVANSLCTETQENNEPESE